MYNWQYKDWPNFTYSTTHLASIGVAFAKELGLIGGLITGLNDELRQEALIEVLIAEAIKTSEIEGEYMSREDVMSSIKRNLGLNDEAPVRDKRATGIAKLMTTVRTDAAEKLSLNMIRHWHQLLMEGFLKISGGEWRKGEEPMQVVSGAYGKETIHYEAPPSSQVPKEMEQFMDWFHRDRFDVKDDIMQALLKAAVAHVYFESIHPFEDGNGRVGRALAEYTLSNTLGSPVLLSISKTIEKDKKQYYDALKQAQAGLDLTAWIHYFTQVIIEAQRNARELVEFTVKKAKFFDRFTAILNERELKVIKRMLENGLEGFEGGMTAKKFMAIAKTSKATATRDLQHLHAIGILNQIGAGRSVRYELVL